MYSALQCGHDFHMDCIDRWLRKNLLCPYCRGQVVVQRETEVTAIRMAFFMVRRQEILHTQKYGGKYEEYDTDFIIRDREFIGFINSCQEEIKANKNLRFPAEYQSLLCKIAWEHFTT